MDTEQLLAMSQAFVLEYGIKVVAALAIIIIGLWVAKRLSGSARNIMLKRGVDATLVSFVTSIAHIAVSAFVIIAALGKLGIQTASFIAVLGAAGLAVGLALQGSLSNFASGVLIILFRPIKIGDLVEAGGAFGSVEDIKIFATELKTPDNKRVIVPNSAITGGNIVNYSVIGSRRVDLTIGVSYDADIKGAKEVFDACVKAQEGVLQSQEVTIAVSELGDSSVNFVVRVWCNTADYWGVYFGLTEKIKIALDEAGIGIPYPQMDLHFPDGNSFAQKVMKQAIQEGSTATNE